MPIFRSCEDALLTDKHEAHQAKVLLSALTKETTVLDFHPSILANEDFWDSIYHRGNPSNLREVKPRNGENKRIMFTKLDSLLRRISYLEKLRIINTCPLLKDSERNLDPTGIDLCKIEEGLTYWPRTFFGYESRFLGSQLSTFLCRNTSRSIR